MNVDETQPQTESQQNTLIPGGPSDATANSITPQTLSPEGLIAKKYLIKSLEDRYQWAPEHGTLIKEKFYQKDQNHLKDLVCKVSKKILEDPIPWLSFNVRDQLLQHKTSKSFLKRSRQGRLNKTTAPKARSRYTLGSKDNVCELGNATDIFFKRPTVGTSSDKPSYTPSLGSQLRSELDSMKIELNSTKTIAKRASSSNATSAVDEQRRQLEEQ
ncbi:hypothetical protein Cgig2_021850 [Carnegiea gigantea]|uniref:Uncharacterized protein n=1 Tax=Carnegiea gigantea TaxID=171969 RepID=A0A9Q1JG71_9CARY|nr:hypothetical protein Cgig2_021850 [Carnegiea gigantea]